MTRKEFVEKLESNFKKGIDIVRSKNHDYAGDEDPWKNFRFAELVEVGVARAILVRLSDKLARISNLLDKEAKVADEKIEDTVLDLINYANILLVFLQDGNKRRDK